VRFINSSSGGHYGEMQRATVASWFGKALVFAAVSTSSAARAADPTAAPIAVVLHGESAELSLEALEQALAEELAVPAVPAGSQQGESARGVLTVTYRPLSKELVVSYTDAARGTVTRVVPAPELAKDVPGVAALVAGNLVRDQASDLLIAPIAPIAPIAQTPGPAPPVSPSEAPPPDEPRPAVHWLANASLFYPLATNASRPELETNFEFNLLYGHIGALNGLEVGTVNTVSGDAKGVEAALLTNLVGGQVRAGQFSLIFNRGRNVQGVQVALLNRSDEAMQGLRFGALNLTGSLSKGLQVSGLNVAGNFEGLQVGLVNVSKHVRGMQIGLVNIADDVDGVPIGLVSVSRAGGVHPVLWSSNTTYANVGVKFATRYTYTMISGAAHYDGTQSLYGGGLTIGASIPIAKRLATEIDLQALHLFAEHKTSCTQNSSLDGASLHGGPYYPQPAASQAASDCPPQPTEAPSGLPNKVPRSADSFPSAREREDDQSLGKLRALLRLELTSHLSLFLGAGVTGKVTYPLRGGDTVVEFRLISEFFGGVQL